MLTRDEIEQAADDLVRAEAGRRQIGLLSRRHPAMTMDDAYAVQAGFVGAKLAAGPVSYTHLDVYKRQVHQGQRRDADCARGSVRPYEG